METNPFTTVRIYRDDLPLLEGRSAAAVIHELLHPCGHPAKRREHLGSATVFYMDEKRLARVSIYRCRECGAEIVLPGEPMAEGDLEQERKEGTG